MGQPMWLCCDAVCGGGVWEGTVPLALLSAGFQSFPLLPTIKLGPSGADSQVGGFCVRSRTLWVPPANSPVRLGVSPAAASTPIGVFSQRLWGFISQYWNPGLCGLSQSLVVPPGLFARKCGTAQSASYHLAWSASCRLASSPLRLTAQLHPSYQSGWMFLL